MPALKDKVIDDSIAPDKSSDLLEIYDKIDCILRHIEHVRNNCILLGKRLIARGETEFGLKLIQRGLTHDNSKLNGLEFEGLSQTADKEKLKIAIQYHQHGNDHHVESWGSIDLMPRIALAELVCDLAARSSEFGTDIKEYIFGEFSEKHKINPQCRIGKILKDFLSLLLEPSFKKL